MNVEDIEVEKKLKIVFMGTPEFSVPVLQALIDNYDVDSSHSVYIGKFNEEKMFYLTSKGLSENAAKELLIMGFISDFKKELPMEYAVELNRLLKE